MELPLWLARAISFGRNRIITPEIPKIYKEQYRYKSYDLSVKSDLKTIINILFIKEKF